MSRVLLEVAVSGVDDAVAAAEAGADRLELSQAPSLGGLTPSLGLFREVLANVRVPVVVLIRPRPGDFLFDDADLRVMVRDIVLFRKVEAKAFAFGALDAEGRIHAPMTAQMIHASGTCETVFHRAFDFVPDAGKAIETLINLKATRVLTSGGPTKAEKGVDLLRDLHRRHGHRIEVLPGGGIRADNATAILRATNCPRLHGSFTDAATGKLNATKVRACRAVIDAWKPV